MHRLPALNPLRQGFCPWYNRLSTQAQTSEMGGSMHIPQDAAARIVRMEAAYTQLTAAVQNGLPPDENLVSLLSDYMASGLWLQDYALDEQGVLPPDLKRGVLSQDGLYNLLQEIKDGVATEEDLRRCCANVIKSIFDSATQKEYIG